MVHVFHNTNTNHCHDKQFAEVPASRSINCNFRCPSEDNKHLSTPIIFKPTINWMFEQNDNCNYNSNSNSSQFENRKCLCLTVVLRGNNCKHIRYGGNGYSFECGLVCIKKNIKIKTTDETKKNININMNDNCNYNDKVKESNTCIMSGCTSIGAQRYFQGIEKYFDYSDKKHITLLKL